MKKFCKYIVSLLFFLQCLSAIPQNIVYQIDINTKIGSNSWQYLRAGLHQAQEHDAGAIILRLNTYGGTVLHADSMRTAILNCHTPIYAFIDNNAASAGALIALACDSIYMRSSASMGAATVVNETGEVMPDKYQSYMRAIMRATAESHGKDSADMWYRNPLIAEAMVDERVIVPNLCDSGKVLTFTANEAIDNRYCEGIVESVDALVTQNLKYDKYQLIIFEPSLFDKIVGFLTNPIVQSLLVMLIFGGIILELKTPGVGLPAAIACTAAILYFAPLYMTGFAAQWEILLFILGIILFIFEIFVFSGFGVAGILGIIFTFTALILALLGNINFNFEFVSNTQLSQSILTVISGLILATLLLVWILHKVGKEGPFKHLALQSTQEIEEGYVGVPTDLKEFVGQEGVATTVLRPSGKIAIGDRSFDAVALRGFIGQGEAVVVVKCENAQLYVIVKS